MSNMRRECHSLEFLNEVILSLIVYLKSVNQVADYRFSFGPWNISEGDDSFGPEVRKSYPDEDPY